MAKDVRPLLGETHDRKKAFPNIKRLEVIVKQDPFSLYVRDDWRKSSSFTIANVPRRVACINPRCQQGGFDMQMQIEFGDCEERQLYCVGHEGTPAGRRKGAPCENVFSVTIRSERG
jgi:hypothetical protein